MAAAAVPTNGVHTYHPPHMVAAPTPSRAHQRCSRAAIVDCSGSTPTVVEDWDAHNMFGSPIEVWITAFDYWSPTVLYTGADDGLFKGWDTRYMPCGAF